MRTLLTIVLSIALLPGNMFSAFNNAQIDTETRMRKMKDAFQSGDVKNLGKMVSEFKHIGMPPEEARRIMQEMQEGFNPSFEGGARFGFDSGVDFDEFKFDFNVSGDASPEIVRSGVSELHVSQDADPGDPLAFRNITQALGYINQRAPLSNVKDQKTTWVINVASGAYDESLTIPSSRIVVLNALGRVTLGDASGAYLSSSTPRSIAWTPFSSSGIKSAVVVPTLIFTSVAWGEPWDRDGLFGSGWDISGNIALSGSTTATSCQIMLERTRVRGNLTVATADEALTTTAYLVNARIEGNISGNNGTTLLFNLPYMANSCVDGTVACHDYGDVRNSLFGGTVSITGTRSINRMFPAFYSCKMKSSGNQFNSDTTSPFYDIATRFATKNGLAGELANGGSEGVVRIQ